MCGRYTFSEVDDVAERFGLDYVPELRVNMNASPTQIMPVIAEEDGNKVLKQMKWAIPKFIGPGKVKDVFNTRSDKAFHNWKKLTSSQRVLVPATGFYEWEKQAGGKQPYFIHPKNQDLFAFAGIWKRYKDEEGKERLAFSIMTTEPNQEMSQIHNRMPVILQKKDEKEWIKNSHNGDQEFIEELLKPFENDSLEMFKESRAINFIRLEDQKLMYPLNSR